MTKEHRKEQALKRAGVPIDELKALANKVDRSMHGTAEERVAHTLEVFNEMSGARKRATSARLSGYSCPYEAQTILHGPGENH